jgi:hypothetical protein
LVVITTPEIQIEMLGSNAAEAKKWIAALQSSRTKTLWSKGFGSVFDRLMSKDDDGAQGPPDNTPRPDLISARKFDERNVVKTAGIPMGLTCVLFEPFSKAPPQTNMWAR